MNVNEHEESFLKYDVAMPTYKLHLFHICVTYVSRMCDVCLMRHLCRTCLTVGGQYEHVNMCPHVSTSISACQLLTVQYIASAGLSTGGCLPKLLSDFAGKLLGRNHEQHVHLNFTKSFFQNLTQGFNVFRTLRNLQEIAKVSLSVATGKERTFFT